MLVRRLAPLAVLAIVLAACGSSDDTEMRPGSRPTTTDVTTFYDPTTTVLKDKKP